MASMATCQLELVTLDGNLVKSCITMPYLNNTLPVCDVVNEVLFEHVAPSFDDIEQSLFERPSIDLEPIVEELYALYTFHLLVDLLIRVHLSTVDDVITHVHLLTFQMSSNLCTCQ